MTGFLSDLLVGMGIGLGIILILSLVLWGLGEWDHCFRHHPPGGVPVLKSSQPKYPTISRADLDVEAAATEAKYYDLPEYRRHRNKFEGRHYDAA